jgi:hypothetical protein
LRVDFIAADTGVEASGVLAGVVRQQPGGGDGCIEHKSGGAHAWLRPVWRRPVMLFAPGCGCLSFHRLLQGRDLLQLAGNLLIGDHGLAAHGQHAHDFFAMARDANFLALLDHFDQGGKAALAS